MPRLTFDLRDRKQQEKLHDLLPHGTKVRIFNAIVDDLIEILSNSSDRALLLGAILTRDITLDMWLKVPKVSFSVLKEQSRRGNDETQGVHTLHDSAAIPDKSTTKGTDKLGPPMGNAINDTKGPS